jgi:prepilin-type N-terminal cleavage/methylation domain-containing protein
MKKPLNGQLGFTLIELVMVIVLIGLLSFGASSLFSSKGTYVEYLAKERLLSLGLLAQQVALGVSAPAMPVPVSPPIVLPDPAAITITRSVSDDLTISLQKLGQTFQTFTLDTSVPIPAINGVALASGSARVFTWDRNANMKDGLNQEVRFTGDTTYRVCFSASGYVYESAVACP